MVNTNEINEVLKSLNNTYFSIGFKNLDEALKINKDGSLILIAAPPSMGKTAFIYSILDNMTSTKNTKEKILFFSCENSKEFTLTELLFRKAEVDISKYYKNALTEDDIKNIEQNSTELKNCNIIFEDNLGITLKDFEEKIKQEKPNVIFIDDIEKLKFKNNIYHNDQLDFVFKSLKRISQENKTIIFVTNRYSDTVIKDKCFYPKLSYLKEYRSLQYIDIVLFIYRPAYYYQEDYDKGKCRAEIVIAKNKWGETGHLTFNFDSKHRKFVEKMIECDVF